MSTPLRDTGMDELRAQLERMFDAGDKERLLDTICELLRSTRGDDRMRGALQQVDAGNPPGGRQGAGIPARPLAADQVIQEPARDVDEPAIAQPPASSMPRLRRKAAQRWCTVLPAGLERETILVRPTEEQLAATAGNLRKTGEERREVLDHTSLHFKVVVYVREIWANQLGQVVTAPAPPHLIDDWLPGPGLLTQVVISKYRDYISLARQVEICQCAGVKLSRNTLVDWIAVVAYLLEPLATLIFVRAMASYVLQVGDTKLPVHDRRKAGSLLSGHLWVLVGDHRYVAYKYMDNNMDNDTDNGSPEAAVELLGGRRGWMQVDDHQSYEAVFALGRALAVGCWMHCRHHFVRAFQAGDARAGVPLDWIQHMYAIEAAAEQAGDAPAERLQRRERDALPLIHALRAWLDRHREQEPPSSPLGEAITFADRYWEALCRPLEDGALELDTGDVDRAQRGTALGRKNWLFAMRDEGAENTAIVNTVIATAARHDVDVWRYIHDVLTKLASGWPRRRLEELLPHSWHTLHAG